MKKLSNNKLNLTYKIRRFIAIFLISFFLIVSPVKLIAQTLNSPETLVKKAEILYQQRQKLEASQTLKQAIELFQAFPNQNPQKIGITAINLCRIQIELGQNNQAIQTCELAIKQFKLLHNLTQLQQSQLYQSYALQQIGLYYPACYNLTDILQIHSENCQTFSQEITLNIQFNNPINLETWRSLGEILRVMGQLESSKMILTTLSQNINQNNPLLSSIQLSLGNTEIAIGNLERDRITDTQYEYTPWQYKSFPLSQTAKTAYQNAKIAYQNAANSTTQEIQIKSQLNLLNLFIFNNEFDQAENLYHQLNLTQVPLSQFKIYSQIQLSQLKYYMDSFKNQVDFSETINTLNTIIQDAEQITSEDNHSLMSYALGHLGSFYEHLNHTRVNKEFLNKADQLTVQALYFSQLNDQPDLTYQWQWQLGRIKQAQGNLSLAVNNYQSAIKTLDKVRKNLLILNPDIQFSFRDQIEPLYREYINILLDIYETNPQQEILKMVLNQVESLQLSELENFLQCDLSNQVQIMEINDPQSLVIYPILLKDKLVIFYQIPDDKKTINYQEIPLSQTEFNQTLTRLQNNLSEIGNGCSQCEIPQEAQKLYQWIMKPLEPILQQNQSIETLVFILDGRLRNIPMTVLYDAKNKEYLLQKKYAVAVVPSLTLVKHKTSLSNHHILLGGVELKQEFPNINLSFGKIQYLREELNNIAQIFPTSQPLVNEQFTQPNLEKQLQNNSYSIIHWKTHGVFSSNPNQTYLVAYQDLIQPNEIRQILNTKDSKQSIPIDLLVLSACETAKGDNRAILGLAGMVIKSGVNSTLSTLWRADDQANTQLMTYFYKALSQPNISKAKALHQAQLSLFNSNLTYQDPHYWATYILVGNWQ